MSEYDMDLLNEAHELEEFEQQSQWTIDNDRAAEWAAGKVLYEVEERDRLTALADEQIKALQDKKRQLAEKCDRRTSYLYMKLMDYFQTRQTRDTKTQRVYQLLNGRLVLKHRLPEYERDDAQIIDWAEKTVSECVKTEKRLDWAALKKHTVISGESVTYAETGEIIPGLVARARPDVFEVQV